MDKDYLILKRALASRPSGEGNDDDFDVLADGVVVGRIMKAAAAPVGAPWLGTILSYEDRTPTHGYEPTREVAMAAFATSWRREFLRSGGRFAFGAKRKTEPFRFRPRTTASSILPSLNAKTARSWRGILPLRTS